MKKVIKDKVLLKKNKEQSFNSGDIFIPYNFSKSSGLTKAKVLDIGNKALNRGFEVGDTVLYDSHSVFYNRLKNVITKVENIVIVFENNEMKPLKNTILLEKIDSNEFLNNTIITNLNTDIFKVIAYNKNNTPLIPVESYCYIFKSDYDVTIQTNGKEYRIVPFGSVVATVEKE